MTPKYIIYEVVIGNQKMADDDVEELEDSLSQFVSLPLSGTVKFS